MLVVVAALLLVGAAGVGAAFLTHTADNRVFFSPDNRDLQDLQDLEATFNQMNYALIVVVPVDKDVFSPGSLRLLRDLTDEAWTLPFSTRVDSLVNHQHSYAKGDEIVVGDLVPADAPLTTADIARVRRIALGDPLLLGRLVAPAADVSAVVVNFRLPADSTAAVAEIAASVRALAAKTEAAHPGTEVRLTGIIMLMATFAEATFTDMALLVPLMMTAIFVVMVIALRSVWGTLAGLAVTASSALAAMGLAGWAGHVLNVATGSAPTIILTLAIADSVHVVTTASAQMRQGRGRVEAIAESMRHNGRPVLLTALSTAVGFFALNTADSPPLNQLGTIVGVGVLIAGSLSLTFLPALLCLLPLRPSSHSWDSGRFFSRLADFVVARRRVVLQVAAAVTTVVMAGMLRIDLNDMWVRYFDERFQFRRDTDFVQARLTGVEGLEYALQTGGEGRITEPAFLTAVDRFATWLRAQPEVRNVYALSDVIKRLNRNFNGDDPAYERIPDSSELAAQYLLFYELSLPLGLDLTDQIDVARSAVRLSAALEERTTRELEAFIDRAAAWLMQNAPGIAGPPTGVSVMFARISAHNIEAMLVGTAVSFVLVSAILLVALRSWRLGLLSLVPNAVPAFMGFGLWGYAVGEVGLAAAVVTSMTFGIVVDDTVHFMSHYRAAWVRGGDGAAAVRHAFRATGPAMAATTAILVAGFLLLGLSGFEVNRSMGLLTATTLTCALLADWFLLPPLLLAFGGGRADLRRRGQDQWRESPPAGTHRLGAERT